MVSNNECSPEGESISEDLRGVANVIIMDETETDPEDEDNGYDGYEPLPMNDFQEMSNTEENDSCAEESLTDSSVDDGLPPICSAENGLLKLVWSNVESKSVDIEMDHDKVTEVKQAMINVTLPQTSIPEWAKNITDDQWKEQLVSKFKNLQGK